MCDCCKSRRTDVHSNISRHKLHFKDAITEMLQFKHLVHVISFDV